MSLHYVDEVDLAGKKVLARFDFNVPLEEGKIMGTARLEAALPTLRYLRDQGVSTLTLMSHLGRPRGKVLKAYSLKPVGLYLAEKLGEDVILTESCTDGGIRQLVRLTQFQIILLENLRFHPEEEKNDKEFAKTLSQYGEVYVNDAFGSCHRRHASTHALNAFYKNCNFGGLLLKKEMESLGKIVNAPVKPFMAIIAGLKVSDKIKTIKALLPKVTKLFIGGAMAYPFLEAEGYSIGKSLSDREDRQLANHLLRNDKAAKIILPIDHVASEYPQGRPIVVDGPSLPESLMGLDLGPKTLQLYESQLAQAKTIFWNGPLGFFENSDYSQATLEMVRILAQSSAYTVVGGGDLVRAVNQSGLAPQINHLSTGGGAALEFIEKGTLPGIEALKFGLNLGEI